MGIELHADDKQFIGICTSVIDWIQNISRFWDEKADGCDAGGNWIPHISVRLRETRVGIDVAHLQDVSR